MKDVTEFVTFNFSESSDSQGLAEDIMTNLNVRGTPSGRIRSPIRRHFSRVSQNQNEGTEYKSDHAVRMYFF